MNWHEKIRRDRIAKHYSQEEYAKLLGVSRMNLIRWEKGVQLPQPKHRRSIANMLHEDANELFKEDGK